MKKKWPDGHVVRFVLRPEADGDTELVLKWFPNIKNGMSKARRIRGVIIALSDQKALDSVERVLESITTSTLSPIVAEKRTVFPITIDGIEPTPTNVQSGRHKWFKEFLFVITKTQSNKVKDFMNLVCPLRVVV